MRKFGVLSIVFGGLGVCFLGTLNLIGARGAGSDTDAGQVYRALTVHGLIVFTMSILLVVVGIGQVRHRAWAVRASVLWAYAGLLAVGLMAVISLRVTRLLAAEAAPIPSTMWDWPLLMLYLFPHCLGDFWSDMPTGVPAAIVALFYAPYPLVMLFTFGRRPAP